MNKTRTYNRKSTPAGLPLTHDEMIIHLPVRVSGYKPSKFSKRRRATYNPAFKIKPTWRRWVSGFPGLTSDDVVVAHYLSDLYDPKEGCAQVSLSTIVADNQSIKSRTLSRTLDRLHERGVVYRDTGGEFYNGSKGSTKYIPNYWPILNPSNGNLIRNAPHVTLNWREIAVEIRKRQECDIGNYVPQNSAISEPFSALSAKPGGNCHSGKHVSGSGGKHVSQKSAKNDAKTSKVNCHSGKPYSDNGIGGATASPASPDGSTGCATAPWRDTSEIDVFAQAEPMADYFGVTLKKLLAVFGGKDPDKIVTQEIISVLAQNEDWLNNKGKAEDWIEFLSYRKEGYENEEENLDPDTIIWLTDSTMVVTGNLALSAESVVGFRCKAPM